MSVFTTVEIVCRRSAALVCDASLMIMALWLKAHGWANIRLIRFGGTLVLASLTLSNHLFLASSNFWNRGPLTALPLSGCYR